MNLWIWKIYHIEVVVHQIAFHIQISVKLCQVFDLAKLVASQQQTIFTDGGGVGYPFGMSFLRWAEGTRQGTINAGVKPADLHYQVIRSNLTQIR